MTVSIEGVGLHGGWKVRVLLGTRPGPVVMVIGGQAFALAELGLAGVERATTVRVGETTVGTVEHLFAACAGMGVHEGLTIAVLGDELPLLDGGAARWCEALDELGIAPSPPRLEVLADGEVRVGRSRYAFARGQRGVTVRVDYDDPRVSPDASWSGDAADFRERIAPARTFAFARELGMLAEQNLASHVTPESVIVLADDAVHAAGRRYEPDEPARHKLLDLMGDLFLYGGPPAGGSVHADRPGHAATHEAVRVALARGLLGLLSS